ncbi:hypothetical protein JCM9140_3616 [Halalkalibacter wakoensis JCM 9140]|uniref:Probable lipid II flippase MurJ n=1 Tax=Halalkalibacter wakoensis JCM 9140 TaxID=1236970 RepID=W4Q719_9BACI|nr:murein biosynthesis integral membrane protein MurJ [Halalkalibacter wakoensis]GAE27468.1 hypothetical protein JCM9140_3616 [Halalkalibacter wakoensis JCM 9140]
MKGKSLFAIIGAVAVINLGSRMIGFLREVVIGYQFGTSYVADSVITAYTLPNFFYIVVGGAVTTAFISVYSKMNDGALQQRFLQSVFTWLTFILVAFTVVLMMFSDRVIGLLFRGLSGEELALTSELFTIMAPATFFLVLSMWLTGILNVNQQFKLATTSTLVMNATFVLIAIALFPFMGPYAHAYGAIISSFAMVVMLIYLVKKGNFLNFRFAFQMSSEFKRMLRLGFPILLGGATLQFYFLIHRIFASTLEEGAIAGLNYASKIVQLPQSVLMTAVTTVIYPLLARKVAANEDGEIEQIYQKGLRMLVITILPASIFAFFYAEEIFTVVFQYGNFTRESTLIAAPLFQALVIAMFAHAANAYVTRFFYAKEKSVLPVTLSVISVFGINVVINFMLIEQFGAFGLAIGTSVSALTNFLLLVIAAKIVLKLDVIQLKNWKSALPIVAICFSLVLVQIGVKWLLPNASAWLTLMVAGIISALVFAGVAYVTRLPELDVIKKKIVRRG